MTPGLATVTVVNELSLQSVEGFSYVCADSRRDTCRPALSSKPNNFKAKIRPVPKLPSDAMVSRRSAPINQRHWHSRTHINNLQAQFRRHLVTILFVFMDLLDPTAGGPFLSAFICRRSNGDEVLLVFYSDYFRGAFNGHFSKATRGMISIADGRVDGFSIVNQFICTRQLSDKLDTNLDWEILIRAWLFGDKYLIQSLQNRVMSVLIEKNKVTNIIPTLSVKLIYANTLPGSPIRKLLVVHYAFQSGIVPTNWVKLIYQNTLPGSPLRRFIVDFTAYNIDMVHVTTPQRGQLWSHEALLDLVKVIRSQEKGTNQHIWAVGVKQRQMLLPHTRRW
jgi:hypothetical protein